MIVIKNRSARNILGIVIPFVLIPATAFTGGLMFREKRHIIFSLAVAVLALLLFAAGFEKKSTGTRRMVICSVMTSMCFIGRFIPFLKPVTAITIITGIYLGGEAGFLVGAMSALLTNFYFGQGPWTAFQMLAWGLTGFFGGTFEKILQKNKVFLLIFGALSGILYSMIMDIWTVLWYGEGFEIGLYLSAITTAIPYTVSYAVSNVIFLWLLFKPFGQKLARIKTKYGV